MISINPGAMWRLPKHNIYYITPLNMMGNIYVPIEQ
jgi:hypothetical protein